MTEIKQTLLVKNHKVSVNLPKDFNYKKVNVLITPYEIKETFSFEKPDFISIKLKNIDSNFSTAILREERDLR